MFTGIIEEMGLVLEAGNRLTVRCETVLGDLVTGGSIAVSGVCLTAVEIGADRFSSDLAPETLERSNLGDLREGSLVNLERPVTLAQRLSGHIVQGHVDGTGELLSLEMLGGDNWWLRVRFPDELLRYVVYKGSIALDGISLTVAKVEGAIVSVAIIPHTYEQTAIHTRRKGERINIECDVLAKHVERLLAYREPQRPEME